MDQGFLISGPLTRFMFSLFLATRRVASLSAGVGFVHGAGIPVPSVSPRVLDGFIHATDWMPTLLTVATAGVEIAGGTRGHGEATLAAGTTGGELPAFDPPFQLGDGVSVWDYLSGASQSSPRTEIIYEAHPADGPKDGNGNALRVGKYKVTKQTKKNWPGQWGCWKIVPIRVSAPLLEDSVPCVYC
jgi:hypothetical protein